MSRPVLFTIASMISLGGCAPAVAAPQQAAYRPAHLEPDEVAANLSATASATGEAAAKPLLPDAKPLRGGKHIRHVQAAGRAAVHKPDPDPSMGASRIYAWSEGGLYRLDAAPEQVSDIVLQPGETLVSVAAGDTARWIIGDTTSGSGTKRTSHVLVKPSAGGLKTNLVIATDRRVYHVEAESRAGTAMASISWTYPDDGLLALQAGQSSETAQPVAVGLTLDELNFDYEIEGDNPSWRPLRAFDDGHRVYIEFPPTLGDGEAPPLFVSGADGHAELVNYRVRGRYYVVEHLFGAAELRMGERRQQVVRIIRNSNGAARGGRRS